MSDKSSDSEAQQTSARDDGDADDDVSFESVYQRLMCLLCRKCPASYSADDDYNSGRCTFITYSCIDCVT